MAVGTAPQGAPPWWVYLIRCGDDSLYCGIARDVDRRLQQHTTGRGAHYTRGRGPLVVVYREAALDRGRALRRERAIKRLSRDDKEALVRGGGRDGR